MLFLQGTRDALADLKLCANLREAQFAATLHSIEAQSFVSLLKSSERRRTGVADCGNGSILAEDSQSIVKTYVLVGAFGCRPRVGSMHGRASTHLSAI